MDANKIASAMSLMTTHFDDFKSFVDFGESFRVAEDAYKRNAIARTQEILQPWVDGEVELVRDADAAELFSKVYEFTNFMSWRYAAYVKDDLLSTEGAWLEFFQYLRPCLREARANWEPSLRALLEWLRSHDCWAFITKALPTYFLALWAPSHHIFVKPRAFDQFLSFLGEPKLGRGTLLTVEEYARVLKVCAELRDRLADWAPRDFMDIHSMMWVVTNYPAKPAKSEAPPPIDVLAPPGVPPAGAPDARPSVRDADLPGLGDGPLPLNLILAGPPGTGKTYFLREVLAPLFAEAGEPGALRWQLVTFHPSFAYEDFVEGLKPLLEAPGDDHPGGAIRYSIVDGIFKRAVRQAMDDPLHFHALFIDEVNRANVAAVFGELITLVEADKRMHYDHAKREWIGGLRVKLPYSHSCRPDEPLFGIPDNLYVVGTMNTADRSIALMDFALRRRFTFVDVLPRPELLRGHLIPDGDGTVDLEKLLLKLNLRIEFLFDRDHALGHSYLLNVTTFGDLENAFRRQILPLLQEYFYGDWEKIQFVLGDLVEALDSADGRPKVHPDAIVKYNVLRPSKEFGVSDEAFAPKRSYWISEEFTGGSFRKIWGE